MKPKNLRFPFSWEEREPLLLDQVLYIPKWYDRHEEWNKKPLEDILFAFDSVHVEYCSGNGTWVAEKAKEKRQVLWIAVEKRFDRVQKIWSKQQNYGLNNLLVVCGDANVFIHSYLSTATVDQVFVNFPDPWPKARHAKHRLLQQPFIEEMWRTVKPKGQAIFVTDDEQYSFQMIQEMLSSGLWSSNILEPFYTDSWEGYGSSYFETLWRKKGRSIRYMNFIREKK